MTQNKYHIERNLLFVLVVYVVMVFYFSNVVHESVHVQQAHRQGINVEEVCYMGIITPQEDITVVEVFGDDTITNIFNGFSGVHGWVIVDRKLSGGYIMDIEKNETEAYFYQILFLLLFLHPINKIIVRGSLVV